LATSARKNPDIILFISCSRFSSRSRTDSLFSFKSDTRDWRS